MTKALRALTRAAAAALVGVAGFATSAAGAADAANAAPAKRPHILWIVSEDNQPLLGCYGDTFARTPNLDRLATQGVRYANAFACAPVCAPSRSSIITGMYATSLGTQDMRCSRAVPPDVHPFPQYLRAAGYRCTNPGKKTDYNIAGWRPRETWDGETDWNAGRPDGQPFFCTHNSTISHESSLHKTTVHEAFLTQPLKLPAYHPDTPEIRSNWVEYYGRVAKVDEQAGAILARLERDGLADDTIVFYFSDHAGVLPRSKRFCYDSGLRAPLIVRFGKNFAHLAPGRPGSVIEAPVSFVDLAPTVLELAGVKAPAHLQGRAFLGADAGKGEPRRYAFSFRNRMDETVDMMRTVRDVRFRYIRNYLPHRMYGQHLNYLWKMPATVSWEKAFLAGKCDETQSAFWRAKPEEELYDLQTDPYEVNNLAGTAEHRATLERLRGALREHMLSTRDTGFLAEPEMVRRAGGGPIRAMAVDDVRYPLARLIDVAEASTRRDEGTVPKLVEWAKDADAGVRYWAAVGVSVRGEKAKGAADAMAGLLKDESPTVRVAAAEALCAVGRAEEGLAALVAALDGEPMDALMALNALDALGNAAKPVADAVAAKSPAGPKSGENYVARKYEWLMTKWGKQGKLAPAAAE